MLFNAISDSSALRTLSRVPEFTTFCATSTIAPLREQPEAHTARVDFPAKEAEWRAGRSGLDLRFSIVGSSVSASELRFSLGRIHAPANFNITWRPAERALNTRVVLAPLTAPLASDILDKNVVAASSHLRALFPDGAANDTFQQAGRAALCRLLDRGFNAARYTWRLAALYVAALFADMHDVPLAPTGADVPIPLAISSALAFSTWLSTNDTGIVCLRYDGVDSELAELLGVLAVAASPSMQLTCKRELPSVCTQLPPLGSITVMYLGQNLRTSPSLGHLNPRRVWVAASCWATQHGVLNELYSMVAQIMLLTHTPVRQVAPIFLDDSVSFRLPAADMRACALVPLSQQYIAADRRIPDEPVTSAKLGFLQAAATATALGLGYQLWVQAMGIAYVGRLPHTDQLLDLWESHNSGTAHYSGGVLSAEGNAQQFGLTGRVGEVLATARPSHAVSSRVAAWFSLAERLYTCDEAALWTQRLATSAGLYWMMHPYRPTTPVIPGCWYMPKAIDSSCEPKDLALALKAALGAGISVGMQQTCYRPQSYAVKAVAFPTDHYRRMSEWHLIDHWEYKAESYDLVCMVADTEALLTLEHKAEVYATYKWYWDTDVDPKTMETMRPTIHPPPGKWGGYYDNPRAAGAPSPPPSESSDPDPELHCSSGSDDDEGPLPQRDFNQDVGGAPIDAIEAEPGGFGTVWNPIPDAAPADPAVRAAAQGAADPPEAPLQMKTQLRVLCDLTGNHPGVVKLVEGCTRSIQGTMTGQSNAAVFGGENAATRAHDALQALNAFDVLSVVRRQHRCGVAAGLAAVCREMIPHAHSREATFKWANEATRWSVAAEALRRNSAITPEELETDTITRTVTHRGADGTITGSEVVSTPLVTPEELRVIRNNYSPARLLACVKHGRTINHLNDQSWVGCQPGDTPKVDSAEKFQFDEEVLMDIAMSASLDPTLAQELETYLIGAPPDVVQRVKIAAGLLPMEVPEPEPEQAPPVQADDADMNVTIQAATPAEVRSVTAPWRPRARTASTASSSMSDFGVGGGSMSSGRSSVSEPSPEESAAASETAEIKAVSRLIMETGKQLRAEMEAVRLPEERILGAATKADRARGWMESSVLHSNGTVSKMPIMLGKWERSKHAGLFHPTTLLPLTKSEAKLYRQWKAQMDKPKGARDSGIIKRAAHLITPNVEHQLVTQLAQAPQMLLTRPSARDAVARDLARAPPSTWAHLVRGSA
nr:capsid protein [Drosophila-associated totivirus 3]